MSVRRIKIEQITEELFNSFKSKWPNANLDDWKTYALDNYLNSPLSIEEIKRNLQEELERKIFVLGFMHNHPKEYQLIIETADSIGNVPERDIETLCIDLDSSINAMDEREIIRTAVSRFAKNRNINIEIDQDTPKLIQSIISNETTRNLLTRILSNESTVGYHTKIAIDGTFLAHNVVVTGKTLEFIAKYLIIHRQPFDIEDLYARIAETDINEMDEEQLQLFFNKTILLSLQKRLGLKEVDSAESKKQIAEFVYQNYIEHGYCFQGINGKYKDSARTNGLSSKFSEGNIEDLNEIDRIFKSHGLEKIFYSKLDETRIAPYYYLSDSLATAYHYSYHNPEWFSYFAATGNNMPDTEYDRTAYYRRDYEACRNNITKLCRQYNLSDDETNYITTKFDNLWENVVAKDPTNAIVFVPRGLINRNKTKLDMSSLKSKTALEIVSELLQSNYNIDRQFLDIPKDKVVVIDVPPIASFCDKERVKGCSRKKYIKLADGNKFYYDILIHANQIDFDCILITDDSIPTMRVEQSDIGEPIDVICCSNNIDRDTLLSNGSISFQSLEMMIAVNGIANSEEGKKLIEKSRADYSPEYMKNYYYHLCEAFCRLASDQSLPVQQCASVLVRMAKDIYPKAELMHHTNKYPQFINEDKKVYEYLTHRERLLLKQIEAMRSNNGFVDDEALQQFIAIFQTKLEGKIDPSFTAEFNKQFKKMINYKRKNISDSTGDGQNISIETAVLNALNSQLTTADLEEASNIGENTSEKQQGIDNSLVGDQNK